MFQPIPERPLLVLGLGNLICQDDGLGVEAARGLVEAYALPTRVRVMDGGTLGLSLLPYIEDAWGLLLLDAVLAETAPGSLIRLEGEDVLPAVAKRLSVHQLGVADLLSAARWLGRTPKRVVLLGLVPESVELGTERTGRIAQALPVLIHAAARELENMGCEPMTPRYPPREKASRHGPDQLDA